MACFISFSSRSLLDVLLRSVRSNLSPDCHSYAAAFASRAAGNLPAAAVAIISFVSFTIQPSRTNSRHFYHPNVSTSTTNHHQNIPSPLSPLPFRGKRGERTPSSRNNYIHTKFFYPLTILPSLLLPLLLLLPILSLLPTRFP